MEPVNIIQSYESAITLLISSLNLFFIIYFYITTRNYTLSVSKYEKKAIQFRELIFEPNQDRLEKFYDDIYERVEYSLKLIRIQIENGEEANKELQSLINDFNKKREEIRKKLGDSIYAFDEEFGEKFYLLIDEFQDKITPALSEIDSVEKTRISSYETLIRENKIDVFKFLHNYEPFDLEGDLKFKFSDPVFVLFILAIILYMLYVFA